MTKSSKSLWARFLFQDKGILPTKRLLVSFIILSCVLLIGTSGNLSWPVIITINMIIFLLSLYDLRLSPRKKQLVLARSAVDEMERGIPYKIEIAINNASKQSFSFRLVDDLPQSFERPFPLTGVIPEQANAIVTYETTALDRGKYELNKLYIRYTSMLGLWEKQITVEIPATVKVIPDLTETREYLENAQQFLIHEGVKIRKQKSGAGDFAKVRSYVVGDDPRKINWRQTAKLQEVMTNEFEPEHGKYITVLIDCGRMMGAELTKGNRLEKALEAAVTVTASALKNGDYVSVLAFSKDIKVYVPPAKGMAHLQTILKTIYDLKVEAGESNYGGVLQYLEMVQKKRSLLLLFSDVRTFLNEESTLAYLKRLRQRHLFLMIGVEDRTLLQRISVEPNDVKNAMVKTIAQQQMLIKKREKIKWEKQGLHMIEAPEEKLAVTAVSHYITIMNQNLL